MSSPIAQNVLMALTVTVNKYASSNVQSVHKTKKKKMMKKPSCTSSTTQQLGLGFGFGFGRRALILSSTSLVAASSQANDDSKTQLLNKFLKKSEENKAKNDKERLDSYYKRNYKDYFDFVEGSLKGKNEEALTQSEKGILEWLKTNK